MKDVVVQFGRGEAQGFLGGREGSLLLLDIRFRESDLQNRLLRQDWLDRFLLGRYRGRRRALAVFRLKLVSRNVVSGHCTAKEDQCPKREAYLCRRQYLPYATRWKRHTHASKVVTKDNVWLIDWIDESVLIVSLRMVSLDPSRINESITSQPAHPE